MICVVFAWYPVLIFVRLSVCVHWFFGSVCFLCRFRPCSLGARPSFLSTSRGSYVLSQRFLLLIVLGWRGMLVSTFLVFMAISLCVCFGGFSALLRISFLAERVVFVLVEVFLGALLVFCLYFVLPY